MELPAASSAVPFCQLPQHHLRREEELSPILFDFPLLLSLSDFKARYEKASKNRKSETGDPDTSPSKHTGGAWSFWTYEDVLALDRDEDDEVTPNDVFLHVHTKDHDGVTFIDNRSARHSSECSEGRVYGIGSLAWRKRRYEDPGASMSREPMGQHSELDAVVQRLAQFEAFVQSQLGMRMVFGASTFQAPPLPPPPPPPQEHHQQVGMDLARSPQ
ncbi:hypothetical protein Scep_012793 [Stephania cephalantha]|uniref:Uncharacterized protein n=1 Tax=Stephania cephalantha TaxID=152367 RepID=A0AAP0JGM6_9MAGN